MSANGKNNSPAWVALLSKALEIFVIIGMAVLVIDVLWGVFSRYVLGEQSRWTEELAIYLLVWISLLGAALTYGEKGHLGVDYFVGKLDPTSQAIAGKLVDILVFFFAFFTLVYGGSVLVSETLASNQLSPALGAQVGHLYLAVPLSGLFFCLYAVVHLFERKSDTSTHSNDPSI